MTDEKVLTYLGLGALGIIFLIAWMTNAGRPDSAGQSDGGFDVEEKIGARVPYYARNGHYAEFGSFVLPLEWERHRLSYPRRPCPLLSGLISGDLSMNKPCFDPDEKAWFSEPPAESVF